MGLPALHTERREEMIGVWRNEKAIVPKTSPKSGQFMRVSKVNGDKRITVVKVVIRPPRKEVEKA